MREVVAHPMPRNHELDQQTLMSSGAVELW
jgi:hypothetical protein